MSTQQNEIFRWWLERGFKLLPVQPGTKYLCPGWGQYQKTISRVIDAECVIRSQNNFAVLGDEQKIIMDFDIPDVYQKWAHEHPQIAKTYTERTPRGGAHVFFIGSVPAGLQLVAGVELKSICLVAPSLISGKRYTRGQGEIFSADPIEIFSSLSRIGTRSAYVLRADQRRKGNSSPRGLIEQIKEHWTIRKVFELYHPEIELRDGGKVITCNCPFHDDKKPSFYILPDMGIWGCHACNIRGDVINLYARFENIQNSEAIKRMAQRLGVRS